MEKGRCAVTLTASSGVLLDFGGHGCAIDALHGKKTRSWSTVTPDMEWLLATVTTSMLPAVSTRA